MGPVNMAISWVISTYTSIALAKDAASMKTALTVLLEEKFRMRNSALPSLNWIAPRRISSTVLKEYYKERDKT